MNRRKRISWVFLLLMGLLSLPWQALHQHAHDEICIGQHSWVQLTEAEGKADCALCHWLAAPMGEAPSEYRLAVVAPWIKIEAKQAAPYDTSPLSLPMLRAPPGA